MDTVAFEPHAAFPDVEDQGVRLTSVKVPSMDWRFFLVFSQLPPDRDFEGRV